jgi:hypothetical protein
LFSFTAELRRPKAFLKTPQAELQLCPKSFFEKNGAKHRLGKELAEGERREGGDNIS